MALIVVLKVLADPPVVHQSTTRDTPGVVSQNTAGGFGVLGQSAQGPGMVGISENAVAAGGEFQNTGGGDLLRAGQAGAFRVLNNGDILVRGQKIGATGPQG
jgi:hypothetical protein